MPTYVKTIGSIRVCHEEYTLGLNVYKHQFRAGGSIHTGGIDFTELVNWNEWRDYETTVALVCIPDDARVCRDPCGTTLKADKIEIVSILKMKGNPWVQMFLNNDPEKILEVVTRNGAALRYVKDQTPEMCQAVVSKKCHYLRDVIDQTPEMCLEAVKQDGYVLMFVKNQTPEICIAAVKQYGRAITFVKDQTPEMCLEAVTQDGSNLQFVKDPTPTIREASDAQLTG